MQSKTTFAEAGDAQLSPMSKGGGDVFESFRKSLVTLGEDISKTTNKLGENIKKAGIETQTKLISAIEGQKETPISAADTPADTSAEASASAPKQEEAPTSTSPEATPASPASPPLPPDKQPLDAATLPPKTPVIPEDTARLTDELGAGRPRPPPVMPPRTLSDCVVEKSKSGWAVAVRSETATALRWGLAVGIGLVLVTAVLMPDRFGPKQAATRLLRRLKKP